MAYFPPKKPYLSYTNPPIPIYSHAGYLALDFIYYGFHDGARSRPLGVDINHYQTLVGLQLVPLLLIVGSQIHNFFLFPHCRVGAGHSTDGNNSWCLNITDDSYMLWVELWKSRCPCWRLIYVIIQLSTKTFIFKEIKSKKQEIKETFFLQYLDFSEAP